MTFDEKILIGKLKGEAAKICFENDITMRISREINTIPNLYNIFPTLMEKIEKRIRDCKIDLMINEN